MANAIAVVGDTGTGKSSSIMPDETLGLIGLNPAETFIINVKDKPLPMRGFKRHHQQQVTILHHQMHNLSSRLSPL
jgi:ABC-type phosphate/phosphonate transport system ATPase subunit